jgi:hypothetical protein
VCLTFCICHVRKFVHVHDGVRACAWVVGGWEGIGNGGLVMVKGALVMVKVH